MVTFSNAKCRERRRKRERKGGRDDDARSLQDSLVKRQRDTHRQTHIHTIFFAHMLRSNREPCNKSVSHTTDRIDRETLIKVNWK